MEPKIASQDTLDIAIDRGLKAARRVRVENKNPFGNNRKGRRAQKAIQRRAAKSR